MKDELNYVDFLFASKIRFNTATNDSVLTREAKSCIFGIRRYIEVTGNFVNMSLVEFGNLVQIDGGRGNNLLNLINNLRAMKLLIIDRPPTMDNLCCYGTPALVLTTRAGKEYLLPEVFSTNIPENLFDKFSSMAHYYVYVCKLEGVVVYVGKGTRSRMNHCLSGKSSCRELNALVAEGRDLTVEKIADNLTEEMATYLEDSYITAMINSGINLFNKALPQTVKSGNKDTVVF